MQSFAFHVCSCVAEHPKGSHSTSRESYLQRLCHRQFSQLSSIVQIAVRVPEQSLQGQLICHGDFLGTQRQFICHGTAPIRTGLVLLVLVLALPCMARAIAHSHKSLPRRTSCIRARPNQCVSALQTKFENPLAEGTAADSVDSTAAAEAEVEEVVPTTSVDDDDKDPTSDWGSLSTITPFKTGDFDQLILNWCRNASASRWLEIIVLVAIMINTFMLAAAGPATTLSDFILESFAQLDLFLTVSRSGSQHTLDTVSRFSPPPATRTWRRCVIGPFTRGIHLLRARSRSVFSPSRWPFASLRWASTGKREMSMVA